MTDDPSAEQPRSAPGGPSEIGADTASPRRLISRLKKFWSRDRLWRRAAEVAAILTLIIPLFIAWSRGWLDGDLAVQLSCVERDCISRGGQVTFEAKISGAVPGDKEILLLHYSVGDVAWFVISPITPDDDGKWATTQTLGNPNPHERERRFKTCAVLLPLVDSNNLKVRSGWIKPHELPSSMKELDCVSPRRPGGQ